MSSPQSDSNLVRRTLDGDTDAFGRLVDRYKEAVYGAAYVRLGNFQDAQDVAQEAFIQAYRRLGSLQAHDRFASWLNTIVRNLCHDHFRTHREMLPLDRETPAAPYDPAEEHDRRALHRRIQRAVDALSDVHRETVTLYYINGYTCEEVGDFLDVPTGTVKRRLFDARKQLKKEMVDMVRDMFDAHSLPSSFRKVVIDGVYPDGGSKASRLYLRDRRRRGLPIEIGEFQSLAIFVHLHQKFPPRPLTYDLFHRTCTAFGIVLDGIGVSRYRNRYRADVTFTRGRKSVTLEADPGDAVALAVRFEAPVYVDESLLEGTTLQRPRAARKAEKRSHAVEIGADTPWALVDRTDEKIDRVRIAVLVLEKPPTDRTRARRLADRGALLSVGSVSIGAENPGHPLIWLSDEQKNARLPIAIGKYEAKSIASELPKTRVKLPRGYGGKAAREKGWAYDLLKAVLDAFETVHERAVIDLLHEDTFYAFSFFRRGKTVKRLDARPSDTIALALRTGAQIEVRKEVMQQAGVSKDGKRKGQKKTGAKRKGKGRGVERPRVLSEGERIRFAIKSRRKFLWESSDPSVASVGPDGVVKGLKGGNVRIAATWKGKK